MLIIKAGPMVIRQEPPQERTIAYRGPEDRCPLRFRIGQQTPGDEKKA